MTRAAPHPNPEADGPQPGHVLAQNCQTICEAGRLNLIDHRHSAGNFEGLLVDIHRNTGETCGKIVYSRKIAKEYF